MENASEEDLLAMGVCRFSMLKEDFGIGSTLLQLQQGKGSSSVFNCGKIYACPLERLRRHFRQQSFRSLYTQLAQRTTREIPVYFRPSSGLPSQAFLSIQNRRVLHPPSFPSSHLC